MSRNGSQAAPAFAWLNGELVPWESCVLHARTQCADEAFLCGAHAEIQPLVAIDRIPIGDGSPGPLTRRLQELYERAVRGDSAYRRWATPVYGAAREGVEA